MLLIDEIDRADDEFEAYLLEILSDFAVTVPELGTLRRAAPADRHRDVEPHARRPRRPQAAVPLPLGGPPELRARGRDRAPSSARSERAVGARGRRRGRRLRRRGLYKPPGVAETIDWAQALTVLGAARLDERTVERTLSTVIKYREDAERIRAGGLEGLVAVAAASGS